MEFARQHCDFPGCYPNAMAMATVSRTGAGQGQTIVEVENVHELVTHMPFQHRCLIVIGGLPMTCGGGVKSDQCCLVPWSKSQPSRPQITPLGHRI